MFDSALLFARSLVLRNPNFFVSKTRLSVRNLPKNITEKRLKEIFSDAALAAQEPQEKKKKAKIKIKQVCC